MDKIVEQIKWYEENAERYDDDIIILNLKLINELYDKIEVFDNKMFVDKAISVFCEIMEIQRGVINDIKMLKGEI